MGVDRKATPDQIKRAYRVLARKYHPDVSKETDAEARFKELGEAYEVLKDPKKREAYDRLGNQWKAGQEFRPPPGWGGNFEFHRSGYGTGDASQFSDFFETLFGGGLGGFDRFGSTSSQEFFNHGGDTHAKVSIDIGDAYYGANKRLSLNKTVLVDGRPVAKRQTLNVRIPKGVCKGQKIRLSGQGDPGFGNKSGDLYLEVDFIPHPLYTVDKRDVIVDLPVAPWELALGATVTTPTPAGNVDLKIPAGTANGGKLRLKGRGIPGEPPGHLYVVLTVVLPPAITEEAKQAYTALQRACKFNPRAKLGV